MVQQQQRPHSHLLVLCDGLEAGGLHVVAPAAQPVVALCREKRKREVRLEWMRLVCFEKEGKWILRSRAGVQCYHGVEL